MSTEKGQHSMTDETAFPSITFPATFEGTAAIGADFSATLKLKTSDGPGVLEDLKALPRGTYDITIVSRQGALSGDSLDREWSSMELRADEEAELDYAATCIGGQCPHFAVATSGDLEGAYVCQLDPEAPVKIEHGETPCPLFPQDEAEGNAEDDGVDELPVGESGAEDAGIIPAGSPVVVVLYPGDDEPHVTEVGPFTMYGELVFDYGAAAGLDVVMGDYVVRGEDDGRERDPEASIAADDHGHRLLVQLKAEEPAA